MVPNPKGVVIDFSNRRVTGVAGVGFLSRMAHHVELFRELSRLRTLKRRARGASEAERTWSLIASLACGNGALSDLNLLAWDPAACKLLGLRHKPCGRRLGEHLARFEGSDVEALREAGRRVARRVVPQIARHCVADLGYVPLFVDATQIEVRGKNFEGAARDYKGDRSYQLGAVFVGGTQVSGRLLAGNMDPAGSWREQLERDVAPLLRDVPVWGRMDNAYYRKDVVEYFEDRGWDYSVSVTSGLSKRPILEAVEELLEDGDWEDISEFERAAFVTHRPARWRREQTYVVVRRDEASGCRQLVPIYTVILVSRDDLELAELVSRHRGKQGQENAFKGPLRDMNLHHPRCAGHVANQAYYECALIAQLLVRAIQHRMLPEDARCRSLGYVIRHVMRTIGVLACSSNRLRLNLARSNWELSWLYYAADRLDGRAAA